MQMKKEQEEEEKVCGSMLMDGMTCERVGEEKR